MLFQNSCVVPFGMTAILSFLLPPVVPCRLQLRASIAARTINSVRIFLMLFLSRFLLSVRHTLVCRRSTVGCLGRNDKLKCVGGALSGRVSHHAVEGADFFDFNFHFV